RARAGDRLSFRWRCVRTPVIGAGRRNDDPWAALPLGWTYNPAELRRVGIPNFQAQAAPSKAREWCRGAADLGSPPPALRLEQLPSGRRRREASNAVGRHIRTTMPAPCRVPWPTPTANNHENHPNVEFGCSRIGAIRFVLRVARNG